MSPEFGKGPHKVGSGESARGCHVPPSENAASHRASGLAQCLASLIKIQRGTKQVIQLPVSFVSVHELERNLYIFFLIKLQRIISFNPCIL